MRILYHIMENKYIVKRKEGKMEFTKKEKNYIKSKPYCLNVLRGPADWYRDLSLNRIAYLKNNYCLNERENIVYLAEKKNLKEIQNKFLEIDQSTDYLSLFSFLHVAVTFCAIEDIENMSILKNYSHIFIEGGNTFNTYKEEILNFWDKDYKPCLSVLAENGERIKKAGISIKFKNVRYAWPKKADTKNTKEIIDEKSCENNLDIEFESFKYVDLRHGSTISYKREISKVEEVILGEDKEYADKNSLIEVPLYSNIAAGEPIEISPVAEDHFYIPDYMLRGVKDCFFLEVRGDSMKNADINHGDYVLIRQQHSANNGDIVAVDLDGEATLKRLKLNSKEAYLMPENPKYSPINLRENPGTVLGLAVAVVKKI